MLNNKKVTWMLVITLITFFSLSLNVFAAVAVTGVTLDKSSVTVELNDNTQKLTATVLPTNATNKKITWSSSNNSIVQVSGAGVIYPVQTGTAIIKVTTKSGGKTASCTVTVIPATLPSIISVTGVSLNKASSSLTVGASETLTATVMPSNATNKTVAYTSSNTLVATVSSAGTVTAVAAGTAIITVTTVDGSKTASCTVTVTNSSITKQDILNEIVTLQQTSRETDIIPDVQNYIAQLESSYKTMLTVNIQDYGAKGNGVDSDVQALKNAAAYLSSKGGGIVYFPQTTSTYVFDNVVNVPKNVYFIGNGTRISRYHTHDVSSSVFNFLGNNVMTGFVYDGGLGRIPDSGEAGEFTLYSDLNTFNEGCTYYNNNFLNAKGEFIGRYSNAIIYNNSFGDYGDHCVYLGYINETMKAQNIVIANNTFTSATSTRDTIKFRNNGENIIVVNNTFDVPKGTVLNFGLWDSSVAQGKLNYISFTNNTIKSCNYVGQIYQADPSTGTTTLGTINNIKIANNIVEACTGYLMIGGVVWEKNTYNYDTFNNADITISGNKFMQSPQIHVCCIGPGIKVNVINNEFYGTPVKGSLFWTYGNASLNVENNIINLGGTTALFQSPYMSSLITAATTQIQAVSPQVINVNNNSISGVYAIFKESSSKGVTYLNDKITFNLTNNTFTKSGSRIVFGIDSGSTSLIKSILTCLGNIVTLDGVSSSIDMTYYPSAYLIK